MDKELERKPKKKQPVEVVPLGNQFLSGLPKKRMSLQEWREYPKELRDHAVKLGIYEVKYG